MTCVCAGTGSKNALYPSISIYKSETSGEFYLPSHWKQVHWWRLSSPHVLLYLLSFTTTYLLLYCPVSFSTSSLLFSTFVPSLPPSVLLCHLLSFTSTSLASSSVFTSFFPSLRSSFLSFLLCCFFTSSFPSLMFPLTPRLFFFTTYFPFQQLTFLHYLLLSFFISFFDFLFPSLPPPILLCHLLSFITPYFPYFSSSYLIISFTTSSFPLSFLLFHLWQMMRDQCFHSYSSSPQHTHLSEDGS